MNAAEDDSKLEIRIIGCKRYEESEAKSEIDSIKPYLGIMDKFRNINHGKDSEKVILFTEILQE